MEVKELVDVQLGFQQWARPVNHALPCSPSTVMGVLGAMIDVGAVDRIGTQCGTRPLDRRAVLQLSTAAGIPTIGVRKRRERFRLDRQRAELTTMTIEGTLLSLKCVVLEGCDLFELVRIRRMLGLEHASNVPVHQALSSTGRYRGRHGSGSPTCS